MGLEDFYLYIKLAELAQASGDNDGTVMYLNLARRAFPSNPQPLKSLLGYYQQSGDETRAQEIAEQMVLLDENDVTVRGYLLGRYIEEGAHDRIADMALQIIYVDIFSAGPHRVRASALRELEKWEDSVFEWTILKKLCGSKHYQGDDPIQDELKATIEIANTWLAAGDLSKAKEAALDAKAIAPDSPLVTALIKNLSGDDTEDVYP